MSPLVERVTNSFPQVQRTVASAYSGWMAVFMVPRSVGRRTSSADRAPGVVLLVGLVDLRARVDDRLDRRPRRAAGSGQHRGDGGQRREADDLDRPERDAVDDEVDRELAGRAV